MGAALSTELKFIQDIQSELRRRRVEVTKKDICNFLVFVHDICPWFVITCPEIIASTWDKVGNELSDHFKANNEPDKEKIILQYWSLLRDIIVAKGTEENASKIVRAATSHLEQISRECSRAPSRADSISELLSPDSPDTPPAASAISVAIPPVKDLPEKSSSSISNSSFASKIKTALKDFPGASRLYPAVASAPTEELNSQDAQTLEEQAAHYHNPLSAVPSPYTFPAPPKSLLPLRPPSPSDKDSQLTLLTSVVSRLADKLDSALSPKYSTVAFPVHLTNGEPLPLPTQKPPPPLPPHTPVPVPGPRTRSRARQEAAAAAASAESTADAAEESGSDTETEQGNAQPSDTGTTGGEMLQEILLRYEAVSRKDLTELLQAVKTYGTQAPYTISCLEALSNGGALLPC